MARSCTKQKCLRTVRHPKHVCTAHPTRQLDHLVCMVDGHIPKGCINLYAWSLVISPRIPCMASLPSALDISEDLSYVLRMSASKTWGHTTSVQQSWRLQLPTAAAGEPQLRRVSRGTRRERGESADGSVKTCRASAQNSPTATATELANPESDGTATAGLQTNNIQNHGTVFYCLSRQTMPTV